MHHGLVCTYQAKLPIDASDNVETTTTSEASVGKGGGPRCIVVDDGDQGH